MQFQQIMERSSKPRNFNAKKASKIFVFILLGFVGLFLGITIIISENIQKVADYFIENEFAKSKAGSVYDLTYDKINLRLLSGTLMVKGVALTPKKAFFTGSDTLRLQNPVVFEVRIPELKIKGLNRNFSLTLDRIDLSNFSLSKPEITIFEHLSKKQKKQSKLVKSKADTSEQTAGIKTISIDNLSIIKGKFTWFDHQKNSALANIGSINFDTKKMTLDLSGDIIAELILVFSNSNIQINDSHYPLENGLYDLQLGSVLHNKGSDEILLQDFRLIPKYDKATFSTKLAHQNERMDLTVQSIIVSKPDFELLVKTNSIELEAIDISGIKLNAFRDKNIPLDLTHFPKLPQQALAGLKESLIIPMLTITDAYIIYEELLAGETAPGKTTIKINNAQLSNITNQQSLIGKNGPMVWKVDGELFDAAALKLNVKFFSNLTNPNFTFSGSIGECNMAVFNMMTENAANLRISSGQLQKIDFDVRATADYATGELTMQYSGLSVMPLKKDKEKRNDELNFLGDIANTVIKNNNPNPRKETVPQQAEVFFVRDKNKSIFNYMAKSLISGIKSSILPITAQTKEQYEKQQEKESKQQERQKERKKRKEKRNG